MAKVYNIQDAESNLPKLIDEVLSGEDVSISRSGKPLVDLSPHPVPKKKFVLGSLAHLIENNMTDEEEKAFFETKLCDCDCQLEAGS